MPGIDQDFRDYPGNVRAIKPNDPPYTESRKKYDSAYPNGDRDGLPTGGLTLLKQENFESGTLAEKSQWIALTSGNQNYSAIVDINGEKVLRHNGAEEIATPDPISGKTRSGDLTHTFRADLYHTGEAGTAVTFEMDFFLDHCHWKSNAGADPFPIIAGKLFCSDTTVDSNAWYFGLTNGTQCRLISGNNGNANTTWATATNGGWCSDAQARSYAWRDASNARTNGFYLATGDTPIFRSDGVKRTLRMEIKYNPDGIGYHLCRISIDGVVLRCRDNKNTDAAGYFPLPPEYKLKGLRWYIGSVDVNNPDDITTMPGTYSGYAAGVNICEYRFFDGVYA